MVIHLSISCSNLFVCSSQKTQNTNHKISASLILTFKANREFVCVDVFCEFRFKTRTLVCVDYLRRFRWFFQILGENHFLWRWIETQIKVRPSKSKFFCASKFSNWQFCAEEWAWNAIKTRKTHKLCQNH